MAKDDWIDVDAGGDAWDQEKPIQGFYKSKRTGIGKHKSNMYMLQTDDGLKGVWGSIVLDDKFEMIPIGAEVRVEHLGKKESKTGGEYNDYKVQYRETEVSKVAEQFDGAEVL